MLCTIKYWRDNIPLNRSVGEPCSTLDESHSIDTASGWGCWHWQVPSWDSSDTFRMLLNGRSSQMRNSNRTREATRTKRARNSSFMRWNMVVINMFVLFHRITRSWAFLSPTSSFWLLLSRIRDSLDNRINQSCYLVQNHDVQIRMLFSSGSAQNQMRGRWNYFKWTPFAWSR